MWMNENDVHDTLALLRDADEVPNLVEGAEVLFRLMQWTNDGRSDGWPYWSGPSKAAARLMDTLYPHKYAAQFGYYQGTANPLKDITKSELTKALTPIKSFLTRQGVGHGGVV